MSKKFPSEFKRDFVTVARRDQIPVPEVEADFDISESTLRGWIHQAAVDDGVRDGLTSAGSTRSRSFIETCAVLRWRTRSCVAPPTSPRTPSQNEALLPMLWVDLYQ